MAENTYRGNIQLPAEVSSEIITKVREDSAVMQLARQITLPGRGVSIPVVLGDPEADFVGETEKKPVADPQLTMKDMKPYKIAVIVPFSNEFRRDAGALYDECVRSLPAALAKVFDKRVFTGPAPGSGFDTLSGATAQILNPEGDATAYDALVDGEIDIADHDGIMNGIVISPKAKGLLLKETDGTGRPLFINNVAEGAIPMILGVPTIERKAAYKADSTADFVGVMGDWTKAMYGTVEGVNIAISDQATIERANGTLLNLFQRNMFAVRAEIEVGFVADVAAFNLLKISNE